MKKIIIILAFTCLSRAVYPQGLVRFSNLATGVNAPVYQSDGVTKLSGSQFLAELFAGPSGTNLAPIVTTSFLTGIAAGYFDDEAVAINSVFPRNTAWVEVDVWNMASGASFEQAQASGLPNSWWQSSIFSVPTGGGGVNPFPAGNLVGLGNSPVFLNSVPEPSTLALGLAGAVVAFLRFRRRDVAEAEPTVSRSSGKRKSDQ